ncbi:hypothetical protein KFL_007960080 [Klebsormidium nitens]|uniref:Uncharacterized protein n=1 Tax=Klebsormidium nitens TaxID=105231 RepID=A0A1Y1ILG1_KLENI|nr:hypothetical protein KFL_007960080 [Klebsormidium nitens]|eukprot:GAQ91503.1 hypothetical protein KFL_007960080 [Klebsormidium nitens]
MTSMRSTDHNTAGVLASVGEFCSYSWPVWPTQHGQRDGMAVTALERLHCAGIGAARGALATGQSRAAALQWAPTGRARWNSTDVGTWGPHSCQTSCRCAQGQGSADFWRRRRVAGGAGRTSVRAQATRKQSGKVALVGKKLQLKPPAPRPEQKEAGEQKGKQENIAQPPSKAREEEANATLVQPKQTERTQEGVQQKAQPASEPVTSTAAAEGAAREQSDGVEAKPTAAQSADEQAAELQALRKALQGVPGGEPARSSSAFYAGVLEEIGLINWPPLGQVAGTTALVMGMLVGAATALTVLNYGLSEGTKAFFEDGPLRDAVKGSLGF